ncbi:HAD-like domain-containing protein [Cytidiella melzeri]|nr:HAD-like domain-containing protein [Cytidiella melzeri]
MTSWPSAIPRCNTLILDIGDVLFTWSSKTTTNIPSKVLRAITHSTTWGLYECGKLSQDECFSLAAEEWSLDVHELELAFQHARESVQFNHNFFSFILQLKAETQGHLRVFAMSNMSHPDYQFLREREGDWSIFEKIFTSANAGMRKPSIGFFRHVLDAIGSDPATTAFVDDKAENVLAARSLGIQGVIFGKLESVRTSLRHLFCDPLLRGRGFLDAHAGKMHSVTNTNVIFEENFTQLLILDVTKRRQLVNLEEHSSSGKWNFFKGKPILTTSEYPMDLDTTSIALTVLKQDRRVINAVLDEMLTFQDQDGIIETYFDRKRRRTDPVVCVNVLSLFYSQGRGSGLSATQAWVFDVLKHRAYLDGTRYYASAESFLYFLNRLLETSADEKLRELFRPLLIERLRELVGAPADAMALAMRIVACAYVGIRNEIDTRRLLAMQLEDGSWSAGIIYRYGKSGVGIGNAGLATALALDAICKVEGLDGVAGLWEGC